jgi:hypothetical protein
MAGTVTGDNRSPLSGAIVMATLQPGSPPESSFTPFSARAISGADGSFTLVDLPPGTYKLCAEQRAAEMLNPCLWSDEPILAAVVAGQTTKGVEIQMQKAVTLTIRLNDAQKLLAKHLGQTAGADLLIGTSHGTSPFIQAEAVSADETGRELRLLVPADTNVDLSIYSGFFGLADDTGAAFNSKRMTIPASVAKSSGKKTIVVQVIGIARP